MFKFTEDTLETKKELKEPAKEFATFEHPLKTMDASPMNFEQRGFKHLEKQEKKEQQFEPVSAKVESQQDAHTLKDIQSHKINLELQK